MNRVSSIVKWGVVLLAFVLMASPSAYGQGGGTSAALTGLVQDASGGVLPGVDVTVKNNATAAVSTAVTDPTGHFVIPALPPGTYTVTIALSGFRTVVLPDVQVIAATPANVGTIKLEIGKIEESVVVTGATEIVQTQSATVSTSLQVGQIQQLPVITHTALDYIVSLPGVDTPGSATRSSTINGLPGAAINITLDGINVQDMRGHEGFFMYIRPMMDSVEEITVSTSTLGADVSGAGAASIRMTTRSGSNRFAGSVYNTWRNQAGTNDADVMKREQHPGWLWRLNTPYWFNRTESAYGQPLTKAGDQYINDVRLQTPGFRVGGPVVKDKLFYFFNIEWFLLPETRNRNWTVAQDHIIGLAPGSKMGDMKYPSDGSLTFNVFDYMATKGFTTTPDSTIVKLLTDISQASKTQGTLTPSEPNLYTYSYVPTATQKRYFPTLRIDYNVTSAHRASFSARYNSFNSTPDFLNTAEARFPGFPNFGGQVSGRYMWQASMRSTFGANLVNEARVGLADATAKGTYFGYGVTPAMFNCTGLGCQSNGGVGWSIGLGAFRNLTGATGSGSSSAGVANTFNFDETLNWLKGKHTLSAGVSFSRNVMRNWSMTPYYASVGFGLSSLDPAYPYLQATYLRANGYPSMTDTYAGYVQGLYSLLTGRMTSFGGTWYLGDDGKYHYNGERTNATRADYWGGYVSDSWRVKPNLTLTLGARYEVQLPMTTDGKYSRPETWQMVYGITGAGSGSIGQGNLYKPGVLTGSNDIRVVPYENNRPAYNTDWNNIAPNAGVAWRPTIKSALLSKILGKDPVFRGGYSLTYTRLGTDFFDANYTPNPGRTRAAGRDATTGVPLFGADTCPTCTVTTGWPVLFRDTPRLFPSILASDTPQYPITPAISESIDIHYPDWPIPSTHHYSFGYQRELGKSTAVEIRYIGNTNMGGWTTWNMNSTSQWSMLKGENGWYDEYRLAQANLRANIIAGRGNTWAYFGQGTGTSPLPIVMAYFMGYPLSDTRNQDAASYVAPSGKNCTVGSSSYDPRACFTSSSWYNNLGMYSPSVTAFPGTGTNGFQNPTNAVFVANAKAAGLPVNFWMANPALLQGSSMLETTSGNTRYNSMQIEVRRRMSGGLNVQGSYQFQFGQQTWNQRSLREGWFSQDSTRGPRHALKANWVFQLPFGHGKKWGSGVSRWTNMVIGGWEVDGIARVQSGSIFNFGGYRLVGMTEQDLQDMFYLRYEKDSNGKTRVYMLPKDVIEQSIIALTQMTPTTKTGYTNDVLPTGRYLAPASGPDCVQYNVGGSQQMCPGTTLVRKITGPIYWKVDLSFVKQVALFKNVRVEARMDLFNVFDAINYSAVGIGSSTLSSWEVTSAATDASASQDPGGRITSFGLRFSW